MRTTVTLDADTESLLREAMRQRGQTFKQALNDAVRQGLAGVAGDPERPAFVQRTFPMGVRAGYDLEKLSSLEAELDAEAFLKVTRRLFKEGAVTTE
ncbi:MAG: antitoxin [Holophagales bacterium]|nr:antitoxin [Holophagales bacterium]MYF94954.1 antitoxin [Holophagales bacterium]